MVSKLTKVEGFALSWRHIYISSFNEVALYNESWRIMVICRSLFLFFGGGVGYSYMLHYLPMVYKVEITLLFKSNNLIKINK